MTDKLLRESAMLEASPFRAKLEGPTPALALPTCVS
jgi:hypothetical protein